MIIGGLGFLDPFRVLIVAQQREHDPARVAGFSFLAPVALAAFIVSVFR